jgi:hypothetical protein
MAFCVIDVNGKILNATPLVLLNIFHFWMNVGENKLFERKGKHKILLCWTYLRLF